MEWEGKIPSPIEIDVLRRFISAIQRCDVEAVLALAHEDIEIAMPPIGELHHGRDAFARLAGRGLSGAMGRWHLVETHANHQPAVANYLRRPGDRTFRSFKIDVLEIDGGLITQVVSFGPGLFPEFGLPETQKTPDPIEDV